MTPEKECSKKIFIQRCNNTIESKCIDIHIRITSPHFQYIILEGEDKGETAQVFAQAFPTLVINI